MSRTIYEYILNFIIGTAGVVVFSQAISFGWYKTDSMLPFVLHVHSEILAITGIALMLVGVFIRSSSIRISRLEAQVKELMEKK